MIGRYQYLLLTLSGALLIGSAMRSVAGVILGASIGLAIAFAASLYASRRAAKKKALVSPAQPRKSFTRTQLRIVVVDSDEATVRSLVRTLSAQGHETKGISDAGQALRLSRQWNPHLVIYGDLVGDRSPWLFAHQLLDNDRRPLDAPDPPNRPRLVRITSDKSLSVRAQCYEFGFDAYAIKPLDYGLLPYWVQETYDQWEKQAAERE